MDPVKEAAARTLVALVKEHRENCDGHCDLTLTSLLPSYQALLGEPPSAEQLAVFL